MLDFWKNKRILITGHTGFKGAWISEMLLLAGANVSGYALEAPDNPALFSILNLSGRMHSEIGDIRDLSHLRKMFQNVRPEFVLHMAAQPIVRTSYEAPVDTYEINVMGTVNVCECIRETDSVRSFLNVTTDKVYKNPESGEAFREEDELDGYDPYSNSKSCSELVTHSFTRSFFGDGSVHVSTARAGNVIGGGDFAKDRIIPDCVRAAAEKRAVILRNPDAIRPFQHVLEPLSVYLEILEAQEKDAARAGAYNVGPERADCLRTEELVKLFQASWGDDFCFRRQPDAGPHEAGFLRLDCTKLKETFSWRPRWDIKEAVKQTAGWYLAWNEGKDMRDETDRQIRAFFMQRENG